MEIVCLLCIFIAIGCLFYASWTKADRIKYDRAMAKENDQLRITNQQLHHSHQQISEQYEEVSEKLKNVHEELNDELQQQQKIEIEIKFKEQEKKNIEAQMGALKNSIETALSDQQCLARQAFSSWCEALEAEYDKKEREYDELLVALGNIFDARHDAFLEEVRGNAEEFERRKQALQKDLDTVRSELDGIRATKAAAMEAQLREQEIKNQATFYTLQLNEADKRDVAYLQSIEYNLREARPLRMLIWTTFYRDKVNELAARAGALGASGIYKITHIDSGISYSGQAKDIKERWVTHVKCSLGIDTPVTSQLYTFTREKGIDNFTFEVLEKCSINELNEKEKFYIDLYQTYDFGLNKTRGNS